MKLEAIIKGYLMLGTLSSQQMSFSDAHALLTLDRALRLHVDFYIASEGRLIQKYAKKDENGGVVFDKTGAFVFEDPLLANDFAREKEELGNVDIEIEPVRIHAPERISAKALGALCGLVDFIGGDGQ